MIYLGQPYSGTPEVMHERFLLGRKVTAHLIRQGLTVFSPIVHCHEMALAEQLPTDFKFWQNYCIDMLKAADEFWVLSIPGWQESAGLKAELTYWSKHRRSEPMEVSLDGESGVVIFGNNGK